MYIFIHMDALDKTNVSRYNRDMNKCSEYKQGDVCMSKEDKIQYLIDLWVQLGAVVLREETPQNESARQCPIPEAAEE